MPTPSINPLATGPAKVNQDFVAGQKAPYEEGGGTLLQHGRELRPDGLTYRTWVTGPILDANGKPTGYAVGARGELRHAHPQFKGSKKDRIRLRNTLKAAFTVGVPDGYVELDGSEELKPLDVLLNAKSKRWQVTHVVKNTVADVRMFLPLFPRAARKIEEAK